MFKGYIYSILSAVFFGSAGVIIKLAFLEGKDSIELLTLQYIIAVILMFVLIVVTNKRALKIGKKELYHTAVLGIIGNTFMTVFYYMAFSKLDVSLVAILLYTYPMMVFCYSLITIKSKKDYKKIGTLIIAFIGCYLALGLNKGIKNFSIEGIIYGLLSAVFYAFMNIYSEKKLSNLEPLSINFYSTSFSLIALCIYRFPIYIFREEISIRFLTFTTVLAVVCEIIPLTLLYAAIKYIGSIKVSIIGNLEIPTAMCLSYLFLSEPVTEMQIFGAIVVLYAIYSLKRS